MNENFKLVHRPHGDCWQHLTQDFWIVHYPLLEGESKKGYYAYRTTQGCEPGRYPWTAPNRRVGMFDTLELAMAAADEVKP